MTYTGDIVHITNPGDALGGFNFPRLCHNSSEAVLVADVENHRLQLRHEGTWSRVLLEPASRWPLDAVHVGGSLFVLCHRLRGGTRIIKYVSE